MNLSKEQIMDVCEEVGPALRSGAVQELRQPDEHTLHLSIRKPGRTFCLELSVRPRYARLLVVTRRGGCLTPAPAFLARLRKELEGGRILSLEMPWDDRVVLMRIARQGTGFQLIAELTGHHANLFLADEQGIILTSLLPSSSHLRSLLAGQPYVPPLEAPTLDGVFDGGAQQEWDPEMELPVSSNLERIFQQELGLAEFESQRRLLAEQVRKALDKVERRIEHLHRDLANLGEPQELMRAGELLKGALGQMRRGMKEISVTDYYQEDAPARTLVLRPELDPKGNLQWYFERYKKSQRGQQTVRRRLAESQREADDLEQSLSAILHCTQAQELSDLHPGGKTPARRPRPANRGAGQEGRSAGSGGSSGGQRHKPFKVFVAKTGRTILVGKGGQDNHELTFKHSSPHDIWLHVRGFGGSHVIIPLAREQEIDPESLLDAAHLAVHYSQAPQEGFVEVVWTRRKWVKAIKGGKPGQVTLTQDRNVAFNLDQGRVQRLLQSQIEGDSLR